MVVYVQRVIIYHIRSMVAEILGKIITTKFCKFLGEPPNQYSWGKPIVISHFLTILLHNFFPEPHINSDQYIHHFFKSAPRIILSTQISFWSAHRWHSPPGIMKNPIFRKMCNPTVSTPRVRHIQTFHIVQNLLLGFNPV